MEVKKHIYQIKEKLHARGACYFCQAKSMDVWCKNCENDLIRKEERCPSCARRNKQAFICGHCLSHPPLFTSTEVLLNYHYPNNILIKDLKFNDRPELAKFFANKLAIKIINKGITMPDALIPVPLHETRQRSRGYNQSLEVAKQLSKRMNLSLKVNLCRRTINTQPQSSLSMKMRKRNVRNSFSLNDEQIPKHIAIIDDVITTGSTINELTRVFKQAGCQQITIWAIARA
jgi:ComF family protein